MCVCVLFFSSSIPLPAHLTNLVYLTAASLSLAALMGDAPEALESASVDPDLEIDHTSVLIGIMFMLMAIMVTSVGTVIHKHTVTKVEASKAAMLRTQQASQVTTTLATPAAKRTTTRRSSSGYVGTMTRASTPSGVKRLSGSFSSIASPSTLLPTTTTYDGTYAHFSTGRRSPLQSQRNYVFTLGRTRRERAARGPTAPRPKHQPKRSKSTSALPSGGGSGKRFNGSGQVVPLHLVSKKPLPARVTSVWCSCESYLYYVVAGVGTILRVLALAYAPAIYIAPLDSLQLLTIPMVEQIFSCCGSLERPRPDSPASEGLIKVVYSQGKYSTSAEHPRNHRFKTRHYVERGIALAGLVVALVVIGLHHEVTNFTFQDHLDRLSDALVLLSLVYFVPVIGFAVYSYVLDLPHCYRSFPVMLLHVSVTACLTALQIYATSVVLDDVVFVHLGLNAGTVAVVAVLIFFSVMSLFSMARIYRCYSLSTVIPIFYTVLTGLVFYMDLIYRPSTADQYTILTAVTALVFVIPAFFVLARQHNTEYRPPVGSPYWW
jgi:hypothetical protein